MDSDNIREAVRGLYGGVPTVWFQQGETLADYGINAIWVGSGVISNEIVAQVREQGARIFVEFNTLHEASYLRDHPEAAPVGADGRICPPPDGWQAVCPSHPGYRAYRMAAFRETASRFDIDGIWLDYHHAHASWEQAEPNLPDTCFCEHCLRRFRAETGREIPEFDNGDISARLPGDLREVWTRWRCDMLTDWVREFREILDSERPGALLGTFHCPWTDQERDGALRNKLHIDLRAQAHYIDVFSTMPYHARFGHAADLEWISRQITWLGDHLGVRGEPGEAHRIWPIVQIADWGETVPVDTIGEVLERAAADPACGVMAFAWHGLHDRPDKQQAIRRAYLRMRDIRMRDIRMRDIRMRDTGMREKK